MIHACILPSTCSKWNKRERAGNSAPIALSGCAGLWLDDESILEIQDLGDSEALLNNRRYFQNEAQQLLKRGVVPAEDGWGGWLGRISPRCSKLPCSLNIRRRPVAMIARVTGRVIDKGRRRKRDFEFATGVLIAAREGG